MDYLQLSMDSFVPFQKWIMKNVFVTSGPLLVPDDTKTYLIEHNKLLRNLPEVPLLAYNSRVIKHLPKILQKEKPAFIYHYQSFFQLLIN